MDTAAIVRTDFATRLYDKLASTRKGKDLFLSPFSIQVALAMCAVGAKGETRRVMADLIGAPDSVDEQNRQYANLIRSVNGEGERPFQLVTANALWGQQGYHFKADFQEAIADFYDGALYEVNFCTQPDEAVKTINGWVSDKTRARIKEKASGCWEWHSPAVQIGVADTEKPGWRHHRLEPSRAAAAARSKNLT